MAQNDEAGTVLSELESKLRAPDSILEPGVLDLLKDYLRAGGKPQAAIEDLSENYSGVGRLLVFPLYVGLRRNVYNVEL